jgi:hypothetical protein
VQGAPAGVGGTQLSKSQQERGRVVELFDGRTLDGWHAVPRLPVAAWPGGPAPDPGSPKYLAAASSVGAWLVQDGAIVGTQNPPGSGLGGYLLTDDRYGDFQLTYEVRPDWPADTGVLVRASDLGAQGFQVLIDHRRSGGIGGFYGNGIGGFHALAYGVDVARDESGPSSRTTRPPRSNLSRTRTGPCSRTRRRSGISSGRGDGATGTRCPCAASARTPC